LKKFLHRFLDEGRAGFTMTELLIVVFIVGLVAVVVIPNVGGGIAGTRTQIAARGLAQMAKYARNMALANQTEVELVVVSNGTLRVRAASGSLNFANRGRQEEGDLYGNAAMDAARSMGSEVGYAMGGGDGGEGGSALEASSESLAEMIEETKQFQNVEFVFEGYTDGAGRLISDREGGARGGSGRNGEGGEVVVGFRSNGVCKPCRFKVTSSRGNSLYVNIDMTGKAKVGEEF